MSGTYNNGGIQFQYPENWEVVDEDVDGWPRSVSVQNPQGAAFWSVHQYPPDMEPVEIAAEALRTMRQEYEDLESETTTEEIEGVSVVGYDMNFCCLDFVVAARARGLRQGGHTYLLLYQAESREFDDLDLVFRAMTMSLLRAA